MREREIGEHEIERPPIDRRARLEHVRDVGDGIAALAELGREQAAQRRSSSTTSTSPEDKRAPLRSRSRAS